MKKIFTLIETTILALAIAAILLLASAVANGQVSAVCTNPTNVAYGLTGNGEIYEINSSTGAIIRTIKNNSYTGNSPSNANGIGFNYFNSKFYYFKRNVTDAPQEFVSFEPSTNTVKKLASSTATDDIHTGCVSFDGSGYYTIDVQGTMHYYNIANNKWIFITSKIVDQSGTDVTNIIKTQSAGDMAIDGLGNMWLLTSSNTNYGLYKFPGNLATTAVAQVNVVRVINPTANTPTGNSFAGIAFKPNGQILMSTKNDNKLYLLQTTNTLSFVGNLATSDVGNDLTACIFPAGVLPVSWKSFGATLNDNKVVLKWELASEYENRGFYVEHSMNGRDWQDLGFVSAKNNPETIDTYTYTHFNSLTGKHYYRIRQVDLDGKISYSDIVTVDIKNDRQAISVWPNPASDKVNITASNGDVSSFTKAQVFDLSGRMLIESSMQASKNTVDVSKLPVGTYLVKVNTRDGAIYSQKIIRQ